ncbi:STAS domain-containing protein [Geomesophilobacter sediminis]|uniref:STAS domain-containing protein n=1 Tax=Geomesophilobacter sediminis TaxID=2798584 RepID=A0A8J7LTT2_9BACT|nr:STAS domain-containing protein [Geomesophilobacter sediminis]MBJ6723779.1 STAS domain-containing protein [Geomesophilobacter sediminis]
MTEFATTQASRDAAAQERVVTFVGPLAIVNGAAAKEALVEALDAAAEVTVDLAGVTELDLIGLQVLCSLHRSARDAGKRALIAGGDNGAVRQAVEAAGFHRNGCGRGGELGCLWEMVSGAAAGPGELRW